MFFSRLRWRRKKKEKERGSHLEAGCCKNLGSRESRSRLFVHQDGEGEVAYVDAQRNMAVAIGERDVKTDVNIKEGSDS